jgi:crotonobetainyl-CoA:carnitine CoA-transferase CaiB-like acyl-CoA transferase
MEDPHFRARGLFEQVSVAGESLEIPAIVPRLEKTPGATRWGGPRMGSHTREVLVDLLQMDEAELASLERAGII